MKRLSQWLMLAAVTPLSTALADSDGYMCVGPNYLALETRGFDSDGQHLLFVYWLHDGIGPKFSVSLPTFQTHGLECTETTVKIRGWDETHEVDVSQANRPRYVGQVASARADTLGAGASARHISAWPSGRLTISDSNGPSYFELQVSNSVAKYPGINETTTIAKFLRLSSDGGFVESKIIFAGTSVETID